MRKSILLAAVLLLAPAVSQAKTLDELLVEKGVITKGEAAGTTAGPSKVSWKNGTRVEYPTEGVTTTISTQLQERYTFTDADEDAGKHNTSSFDTNLARVIVAGTALHEEFSYKVEGDFVGAKDDSDGQRSANLKDAYLQWKACDWAAIKMGQFKTALSRQFNTSEVKLQFADRSLASNYFNNDRQQGAAGSFDLADGMVKVGAGVFNGKSDGEGSNLSGVDTKETGVVNVRVAAMGEMDPFEEGDVGWTEDPALNFGAAYQYDSQNNNLGAGIEKDDASNISADANFKMAGLSVHGEYFYKTINPDNSGESNIEPSGTYVQVGYFLDPHTIEVAARYSYLDCDSGTAGGACDPSGHSDNSINESTVGVNYFFWNHNLKAQLDYVNTHENVTGDSSNLSTNKWIFQLSAYL